MDRVSVRELRNQGASVLDRVERGSSFIVTRDGSDVAELRPVRRTGPSARELIARRQVLPAVDPVQLRIDLDDVIDQSW